MRRTRPTVRPGRTRTAAADRGSVVLLALAAVATATLLGLTIASTRDANLAASGNLAKAAKARAAAAGAAEVAADMLRDPAALADAGTSGGTLFSHLSVGDAISRADIKDLITGAAPHAATEAVEITVVGNCGGVEQTARTVGRIGPADPAGEADLDCSEFALLATDSLAIEAHAHLGRWPSAPLSALCEPVAYGMAHATAGGLSVSPDASVFGCARLELGAFASSTDDYDNDLSHGRLRLPAAVHVALAPLPEAAGRDAHDAGERDGDEDGDEDGDGQGGTLRLDGIVEAERTTDGGTTHGEAAVARIVAHGDAVVPARAAAVLRGNALLEVAGDFVVERGARLRIEGATSIIVRGNLRLEASAVEVAMGARLTVVALGDSTLDASYLGGERTDPGELRDASGLARYDGGAARVALLVAGAGRVSVLEGSVLKGEIHAPEASVSVASRSAVYGRILGRAVALRAGAALYFDPALDAQRGWSRPASGIWTSEGGVQPAVRNVARLDAASLARFAEDTGVVPAATLVAAEPLGDEDARNRGQLRAAEARAKAARAVRNAWKDAGDRGFSVVPRFASLGFDAPLSVEED